MADLRSIIILLLAVLIGSCGLSCSKPESYPLPGSIYFASGGILLRWMPASKQLDTLYASEYGTIKDISPDGKSLLLTSLDSGNIARFFWVDWSSKNARLLLDVNALSSDYARFCKSGGCALLGIKRNADQGVASYLADSTGYLKYLGGDFVPSLSPSGRWYLRKTLPSGKWFVIPVDSGDVTELDLHKQKLRYEVDYRVDWWTEDTLMIRMIHYDTLDDESSDSPDKGGEDWDAFEEVFFLPWAEPLSENFEVRGKRLKGWYPYSQSTEVFLNYKMQRAFVMLDYEYRGIFRGFYHIFRVYSRDGESWSASIHKRKTESGKSVYLPISLSPEGRVLLLCRIQGDPLNELEYSYAFLNWQGQWIECSLPGDIRFLAWME
ncbi:hypothetical protein JW877_10120 [bacterium]|nr:hypothetical protein [bacterium]